MPYKKISSGSARSDAMRRHISIISAFLMFLFLVSCASYGSGAPSWVRNAPESIEVVYGVGKCRMSTVENSRDASYGLALSDLAAKMYPVIDEAAAAYSVDDNAEAFERIRTNATSTLASYITKKEVWVDEEGAVWTLVSASVLDFPSCYATSVRKYLAELEEKRTVTLKKLEALTDALEFKEDADGTDSSDVILLKEKSEKRAAEIISEIDRIENSLDIDAVVERIRTILKREGYRVN